MRRSQSPTNRDAATLRALASGLLGRSTGAAHDTVGGRFDERVVLMLDQLDHGEAEMALEDLASNVYEFGVHVSDAELDQFAEIGSNLGIDPDRWSYLCELVQ
ncbi:MAG: hypothetical protein ABI808_16055 [Pseudonocardiales bacterium]